MIKKFIFLFFFAAIFHLPPVACFAKESAGTFGAAFLAVPVTVRSMGMGGAGVAVPGGSNAAQINPAALTHARKTEASFSFQDTLADTSLGFVGLTKPLSFRGVSELGGATLFGNAVYLSKGNIEINQLNSDGSLNSSLSKSAGYDVAVSLGYAEHFFRGNFGIPFLEEGAHSLGFAVRGIHSNLAGTYNAQAASMDLGYLSDFRNFSLGLSATNLGSKLKFIEEGDPLPVALRMGISVFKDMGIFGLRAALDALHQEETLKQLAGVELALPSNIALRGGWRFERTSFQGGPTAGFGVDLEHLFVDYAFNWFGDLRDTHRLLLGFRFGSTMR